ncbi:unnamed protein product [Gordionus sp. m RMFG-2023]
MNITELIDIFGVSEVNKVPPYKMSILRDPYSIHPNLSFCDTIIRKISLDILDDPKPSPINIYLKRSLISTEITWDINQEMREKMASNFNLFCNYEGFLVNDHRSPCSFSPTHFHFKRSDGPPNLNKSANATRLYLIEIAIFLDVYCMTDSFINGDSTKGLFYVSVIMNMVNTIYRHPSMSEFFNIQFKIKKVGFFLDQPSLLKTSGEINNYALNFCQYIVNKFGTTYDNNNRSWEASLMISSLDLWSRNARRSADITGGAFGPICQLSKSCAVVEGCRRTGYTAYGTVAHEMGHLLQLSHDEVVRCANGSYIMRAQDTLLYSTWSPCSLKTLREVMPRNICLLNKVYTPPLFDPQNTPGQLVLSHQQCESVLGPGSYAYSNNLSAICQELVCYVPGKPMIYYYTGALEGTYCGNRKWCKEGSCKSWPKDVVLESVDGEYGPWRKGLPTQCMNPCIENSIGIQEWNRTCNSPWHKNDGKPCEYGHVDIMRLKCYDFIPCDKLQKIENNNSFDKIDCLNNTKLGIFLTGKKIHQPTKCRFICEEIRNFNIINKNDKSFSVTKSSKKNQPFIIKYPEGAFCSYEKETGEPMYCVSNKCRFTKTFAEIKSFQNDLSYHINYIATTSSRNRVVFNQTYPPPTPPFMDPNSGLYDILLKSNQTSNESEFPFDGGTFQPNRYEFIDVPLNPERDYDEEKILKKERKKISRLEDNFNLYKMRSKNDYFTKIWTSCAFILGLVLIASLVYIVYHYQYGILHKNRSNSTQNLADYETENVTKVMTFEESSKQDTYTDNMGHECVYNPNTEKHKFDYKTYADHYK